MLEDVMIDLETAGMMPGCVVLTTGAVRFDRRGDDQACAVQKTHRAPA